MAVRGTLALSAVALVAFLAASLGALAAPGTAAPATGKRQATLSTLESGVLQELNAIRREHGLVPLRLNLKLSSAADAHSREMGAVGYFEHNSHDGTAFWKRINRWYGQGRFGFWSVGENLLWSSPDVVPASALELWMHSPEHRKNILTAKWREIGISAVHVEAAPGTFNDLPVTIITTDFGVRR
jgi:uncharacterized protein YkwD